MSVPTSGLPAPRPLRWLHTKMKDFSLSNFCSVGQQSYGAVAYNKQAVCSPAATEAAQEDFCLSLTPTSQTMLSLLSRRAKQKGAGVTVGLSPKSTR